MSASRKTWARWIPEERLRSVFPWPLWAVGWLAILKGVVWLATDPNLPDPLLKMVGLQHTLLLVPFVVGGIGLWHGKKWAIWMTFLAALVDLIGYAVFPGAFAAFKLADPSILMRLLWASLILVNGPLGDLVIIVGTPFLLKHLKGSQGSKKIAKTT